MKILIVCYSRTGVTQTVAMDLCNELKNSGHEAAVEMLIDTKNRQGIKGWLIAGKDASFKKRTELEPVKAILNEHDVVVIGTPVWAFTMAPAVRTFLEDHAEHLPKVAFFCTMGGSGDVKTFKHMQELCGKEPLACESFIDKNVRSNSQDTYVARLSQFTAEIVALAGG